MTYKIARATIIVEEESMNNLVEQIRKKQDEIILMVNSSFDEIIKEVSKMDHLPNK